MFSERGPEWLYLRFLPSANSGLHVSTSGELLEMGREVHEHAPLDHRVSRSAQYCEILRVSGTCKTGSEEEVISVQRRLGEV